MLNIYNAKGVKISNRNIAVRRKDELTLSADSLERGILLYELAIDGKSIGEQDADRVTESDSVYPSGNSPYIPVASLLSRTTTSSSQI